MYYKYFNDDNDNEHKLKSLDEIKDIKDSQFVVELNLQYNKLTTLSEHIFDNLTNLKELCLYNNNFSTLPEHIFDKLTNIKELYLYNYNVNNFINYKETDLFKPKSVKISEKSRLELINKFMNPELTEEQYTKIIDILS